MRRGEWYWLELMACCWYWQAARECISQTNAHRFNTEIFLENIENQCEIEKPLHVLRSHLFGWSGVSIFPPSSCCCSSELRLLVVFTSTLRQQRPRRPSCSCKNITIFSSESLPQVLSAITLGSFYQIIIDINQCVGIRENTVCTNPFPKKLDLKEKLRFGVKNGLSEEERMIASD